MKGFGMRVFTFLPTIIKYKSVEFVCYVPLQYFTLLWAQDYRSAIYGGFAVFA